DVEDVKNSIKEFGIVQPIIVNSDNRIIGGHGRKKALLELMDEGFELDGNLVPVIKGNYSEQQAQLLLLALNKVHGRFDPSDLAHFIQDMESEQLLTAGFKDDEISDLRELLGELGNFEEDYDFNEFDDDDMEPYENMLDQQEVSFSLSTAQAEIVNAELNRVSRASGRTRDEALCLAMAGSASFSVEELTEKYVNVLSVPIPTDTESADLTEAVF
ncbi:uncharacterized protein METZ01_LOCUS485682, partial [marine metagenome]